MRREIAKDALRTLSQVAAGKINLEVQVDYLFILLGRVLHIEEAKEGGVVIEAEIHEIVQSVYPSFTSASDERVRAAALDILRYLPLRTANEITYVLALAHKTTDQQVQSAIAGALVYANPQTPTDKNSLELGRKSPVEVVRKAVEERLARLK